jgi:predicted ester cyclase
MFRSVRFILAVLVMAFIGMSALSAQDTASIDLDSNRELVEAFVAALDAHDLDQLDPILSADFIEHNPLVAELPPGAEGFKMVAAGILAAFPDVDVTVDFMLAEGDLVATRHTVRASHQGEFNGIPATGIDVTWTELHLFRIADGLIVEHWAELNPLNLLAQIGAMPAP